MTETADLLADNGRDGGATAPLPPAARATGTGNDAQTEEKIDREQLLAQLGILYGWMPRDILQRLTWKQIVTLYRRGWEAEEMRGSAREAGRVHLYNPPEGHGNAEEETPRALWGMRRMSMPLNGCSEL